MPLTQTVAPAIEPITLTEAKLQARVIDNSEDALLTLMIGSARRYAEAYCGRSFITQQWRLTLDSFPGPWTFGVRYGKTFSLPAHAIQVERSPVQSVQAITYRDMQGVWQTMPPTDYVVDIASPVGRIVPVFGVIWPITQPQIASVRVDFTAGYGSLVSDVPEGIRQWLLIRVAGLYENREEVAAQRYTVQPVAFIDRLLDPYVVQLA